MLIPVGKPLRIGSNKAESSANIEKEVPSRKSRLGNHFVPYQVMKNIKHLNTEPFRLRSFPSDLDISLLLRIIEQFHQLD